MKPLHGTELKRFLRDFKRQNNPNSDLSILLQSVEYPANVGSIFRLADGAGASALILTGITPTPPQPTIEKIGRYKSKKVPWRYINNALEGIDQVRSEGYEVIALELTDTAVPYYQYDFGSKVCLVAGHEDHGVTKSTLAVCDGSVFVPMYGTGRSHNVQTALAIVVYHILHSG